MVVNYLWLSVLTIPSLKPLLASIIILWGNTCVFHTFILSLPVSPDEKRREKFSGWALYDSQHVWCQQCKMPWLNTHENRSVRAWEIKQKPNVWVLFNQWRLHEWMCAQCVMHLSWYIFSFNTVHMRKMHLKKNAIASQALSTRSSVCSECITHWYKDFYPNETSDLSWRAWI